MKKRSDTPPKLAERILRRALEKTDREHVLGDFQEFFEEKSADAGRGRALRWYWCQAIKTIPHLIRNYCYWRVAMFSNYLKVALRNISKHKGYAFINVFGLAAGMACCGVLFLYIANESAYDKFHEDGERIYRVLEYRKVPAGEFVESAISGSVATVMKERFPEVEAAARVMPIRNGLLRYDNLSFFEDNMMYADPELFDIFSIEFLAGDPQKALAHPNAVAITERLAKKYFGEENPIEAVLEVHNPVVRRYPDVAAPETFEVTAVVANPPANTHLNYDLIASVDVFEGSWLLAEWHAGPFYTYIKLAQHAELSSVAERVKRIAYEYVGDDFAAWGQTRNYLLQPLYDIHFQSTLQGLPIRSEPAPHGNRLYLYIYSIIGFLVLMIGCMNFINLSNSRSIYRTKEVGLRKVVGAQRLQLTGQFLGESILITLLAILLMYRI